MKQFWFRPPYLRRFSRDVDMSGAAPGASSDGVFMSSVCAAAEGEGAPARRSEDARQDDARRPQGAGTADAHAESAQTCEGSNAPDEQAARAALIAAQVAMAGEHAQESELGQAAPPILPDALTDERGSAAHASHAPIRQSARHERLAQRATRALDRYGYYIAVGICALMVMIGAAAGMSGYGGLDAAPTPLPSRVAEELTGDVDARQASSGGALLGGEDSAAGATAGDADGESAALRLACWPLEGDVAMGHETDRLVYLETMNVYGTHPGIDIAGGRGQVVSVCHDGEVSACWRESLMGNVVEVRGDDGLVTRYANLMSLELVKEGQRVSAGDAIGAIGASAMSESLMQPHLHFEVLLNGESVPPLDYLPARGE